IIALSVRTTDFKLSAEAGKFGPVIARRLRQRRPRPSNRWHLDEMVVRIAGERMYLWRAADHEGEVLDMLVQRRRDTRGRAAADAQAAQEARVRAEIAGHRQVALLRRGVPASPAYLSASARAAELQSGGKLASGSATTRAQAAALQVASICSALPQHARCGSQHLQPATPPHLPIDIEDLPSRS